MHLTVNGELVEVCEGASVSALLAQLEIESVGIAVERNREIVPRSVFGAVRLEAGDELEIVQFVGGG